MPPPTTCKVKKLSFPLVRFLAAGSFAPRAGQDIERESSRIRLTMFAVLDRSTQTLGTCNRQQLQTNLIFDFVVDTPSSTMLILFWSADGGEESRTRPRTTSWALVGTSWDGND